LLSTGWFQELINIH